ncbi:MAG: C_GCAxxG_C_C family protein [Magnetococcales bacterium]|nr:C_GCAxxG_C_C family protein [Magnetococcales bacterium]
MTKDEIVAQVGALARTYYDDAKYSCAEAMLRAVTEVMAPHRFDPVTITRIATPFNGGFSELQQTCGALTAGLMAIGVVAGRDQPGDEDAKEEAYTLAQIYYQRFMERVGTSSCKELLERWRDQGESKIHCKRHTQQMGELLASTILQVGFHDMTVDKEVTVDVVPQGD